MQFYPKSKVVNAFQWWPGKTDEIQRAYKRGPSTPPTCEEVMKDGFPRLDVRSGAYNIYLHPGDWIVFDGSPMGNVMPHRDFIENFEPLHQEAPGQTRKSDDLMETAEILRAGMKVGGTLLRTDDGVLQEIGRKPCLDPDKMNGAGDQFPGSDFDGASFHGRRP